MILITVETSTSFSIRTQSHDATIIDWKAIMKVMRDDGVNYRIKVLEKN